MLRLAALAAALVAVAVTVAGPAAASKKPKPFPEVIQLPVGFQPEGIEVGTGTTFYVGSVANGAVYRGNLRTGTGSLLVAGAAGKSATGIEYDRGRLFVAGGNTGTATVYDAGTGATIRTYQLGTAPTFINDVVVTKDAAYFTDSQKAVLYKVPIGAGGALGDAQTIPLTGDYVHVAGAFNLNGIDATPNGATLVAVQSTGGKLYRIDPASVISLATPVAGSMR